MQNRNYALFALGALALLGQVACNRGAAAPTGHEHGGAGHGHGHGADEGPEPIRTTVFTDKVQLFMEYPHLAADEHAEFLAHLTVLETGHPVRSGSLTFELTTPDGEVSSMTWNSPRRDGLFVPEWEFRRAGPHRLRLILQSPQVDDRIDVGEIFVHKTSRDAAQAAEVAGGDEPANLVPFLLEQQWKIGLRYETAQRRTLVHRLQLPGQIVAPQGAAASVSPPIAGRLRPPPGGRLPRIGERVEAGQALALVEPPRHAREIAQLSANLAQVRLWETELTLRELDLDAKAAETQRSITQAEARLAYARQVMARTQELHDEGISSERQLEEAEQNLRVVEAELQGAQALKRSYDQARQRLTQLRERSLPEPLDGSDEDASLTVPLRAPISGEVVSVAHIEGEHLDDAHQEVFRIVNLDHVWVTAGISEFDLAALSVERGATMVLAAYPDRRFDILAAGGRLVHVGKLVDPSTRTVSVTYEIPNSDGLFRIGMFADVSIETREATDAVAVPEEAVVMEAGRPIAFVVHDGESFIKRELVTGVRDGGFVEIENGISAGERVVTKGAYALKLASMSPSSFGHGHVH